MDLNHIPSTPPKTPQRGHRQGNGNNNNNNNGSRKAIQQAAVTYQGDHIPASKQSGRNNKSRSKNFTTTPALAAAAASASTTASAKTDLRTTPPPLTAAGGNLPSSTRPTPVPASAKPFAGSTFHASPAPSTLPLPSFLSSKSALPESPSWRGAASRIDTPSIVSTTITNTRAASSSSSSSNNGGSAASVTPPTPKAAAAAAPGATRGADPARLQREESPLDFMFRADREERARAKSVHTLSGPFQPPPLSPLQPSTSASPTVARAPGGGSDAKRFRHVSGSGMPFFDMDQSDDAAATTQTTTGFGAGSAGGKVIGSRSAQASSYHDRIKAASSGNSGSGAASPGSYHATNDYNSSSSSNNSNNNPTETTSTVNNNSERSAALKAFLFSGLPRPSFSSSSSPSHHQQQQPDFSQNPFRSPPASAPPTSGAPPANPGRAPSGGSIDPPGAATRFRGASAAAARAAHQSGLRQELTPTKSGGSRTPLSVRSDDAIGGAESPTPSRVRRSNNNSNNNNHSNNDEGEILAYASPPLSQTGRNRGGPRGGSLVSGRAHSVSQVTLPTGKRCGETEGEGKRGAAEEEEEETKAHGPDIRSMEDSLRRILRMDSSASSSPSLSALGGGGGGGGGAGGGSVSSDEPRGVVGKGGSSAGGGGAAGKIGNLPGAAASVPNYVGGRAPPLNGMHNGVMGS